MWQLPLFWSERFETSDGHIPLFLSPEALRAGWVRTGHPEADAPTELTAMDLRAVVARMGRGEGLPWRRVRLVSSVEAYELVQHLAREREVQVGAAAAAAAADEEVEVEGEEEGAVEEERIDELFD